MGALGVPGIILEGTTLPIVSENMIVVPAQSIARRASHYLPFFAVSMNTSYDEYLVFMDRGSF